MGKQYLKAKYKILVILGHIVLVMLAVGIICAACSRCVLMSKNGNRVVVLNPFEEAEEYVSQTAFRHTYLADASSLVRYLAVCKQFETVGEFDEGVETDLTSHFDAGKEVDLLSYYFRKTPSADEDSQGVLVYRVQDLIAWNDLYGFGTNEDGSIKEVFLPTDGVSVYEKREDIFMLMNIYRPLIENAGAAGFERSETGAAASADIALEEDGEEYAEETDAAGVTETAAGTTLNIAVAGDEMEKFGYAAKEDIFDFGEDEISYEDSYKMLQKILMSVASDLSYNYSIYQDQKDYFASSGNNFKYLYLPDKRGTSKQYYTNLSVKHRTEAVTKAKKFCDSMAAYIVIDAESGNIDQKMVDILASRFLYNYNQLKYAFKDYGGKIYIGVLKMDAEDDFAVYADDDLYAQIYSVYENSDEDAIWIVALLLTLFRLSLILLITDTVQCGRVPEDDKVHLIAFDRLYTELALALGVLIAIGVAWLGIVILRDLIGSMSDVAVYRLVHNHYLMMAGVVAAAILDGVFLFFYGSLIRRIKARTLLSGSLLGKLAKGAKRLVVFLLKGIGSLYRHANVVGKSLLTFLPLLFLMHLHLLAGLYMNDVLLVLCWILDAAVLVLFVYISLARGRIIRGIDKISSGELEYQVDTQYMYGDNLRFAEAVNHIGDGIREAVNQSMKDERMKADLITNVSHDIKTPLTSIINYVDLLKREQVQDEKVRGYIEVLDNKSQRLKQLTEDLVEASKISSGNIVLNMEDLNVVELLQQAMGEFTDRFEEKELKVVMSFSDTPCMIRADSRRMWRVIDNLLGNIYKYAMEKTRVYIEVKDLNGVGRKVSISMKNISKQALNIDADELTERFIRGDISRSTEGSGLGLSIAKNLVEAPGGTFNLYLDGDLFKVTIIF